MFVFPSLFQKSKTWFRDRIIFHTTFSNWPPCTLHLHLSKTDPLLTGWSERLFHSWTSLPPQPATVCFLLAPVCPWCLFRAAISKFSAYHVHSATANCFKKERNAAEALYFLLKLCIYFIKPLPTRQFSFLEANIVFPSVIISWAVSKSPTNCSE